MLALQAPDDPGGQQRVAAHVEKVIVQGHARLRQCVAECVEDALRDVRRGRLRQRFEHQWLVAGLGVIGGADAFEQGLRRLTQHRMAEQTERSLVIAGQQQGLERRLRGGIPGRHLTRPQQGVHALGRAPLDTQARVPAGFLGLVQVAVIAEVVTAVQARRGFDHRLHGQGQQRQVGRGPKAPGAQLPVQLLGLLLLGEPGELFVFIQGLGRG